MEVVQHPRSVKACSRTTKKAVGQCQPKQEMQQIISITWNGNNQATTPFIKLMISWVWRKANALFCWDRQLPLCYHFLCLTILSAASLNSILINWSLKNMLNYQIIKFYTVSVWTIQKNYFDKKCCQIKTNITDRSASQHHKKQYVRLWNKSTGLKKINWEIEMNKEIVFSEGLFPPGKLWSHTPTNQTKQSSSGSCHLNSGFEQLINKAGQNLTPVTYTLDSYVLLLVCPPHLKKLEKSGKLDQWWTNNRKSLWSVPYLCSHHFWRAMDIRQIRAVVD